MYVCVYFCARIYDFYDILHKLYLEAVFIIKDRNTSVYMFEPQ